MEIFCKTCLKHSAATDDVGFVFVFLELFRPEQGTLRGNRQRGVQKLFAPGIDPCKRGGVFIQAGRTGAVVLVNGIVALQDHGFFLYGWCYLRHDLPPCCNRLSFSSLRTCIMAVAGKSGESESGSFDIKVTNCLLVDNCFFKKNSMTLTCCFSYLQGKTDRKRRDLEFSWNLIGFDPLPEYSGKIGKLVAIHQPDAVLFAAVAV